MSARDVLSGLIGGSHPPEVCQLAVDALVKETRDQTLAEATKKLRRHAAAMGNQEWATGTYIGADLIDPASGMRDVS